MALAKIVIYDDDMGVKGNSLVITDGAGKYLMQFRDDNPGISRPLTWDFFGGGIDPGEDILESAARELQEELGIVTTPNQFEILGDYADEDGADVVIRFQKKVEWGEFSLHEGAGCGFFTKQELLKLPLHKRVAGIINTYYV